MARAKGARVQLGARAGADVHSHPDQRHRGILIVRPCPPASRSPESCLQAGQSSNRPSSSSVAGGPYLSRGGQGRSDQCGSKAKLETVRPSGSAPLPAPSA
jgi:hypothetical protein